ncbi:MAG: response regulator [Candidatus Omnitrophica bacterium]|nr:response regulator [Candidatus Omnitrophota bacterium]MDD5553514.1 response regulator [Candidatus Omnitrophota bacterium]
MKKKIMVVDDDEKSLELVKSYLEPDGGYEVLALAGAKEILTQVRAFKPDVILLDLLMPNMGGIEACEALNSDPLGSKVPIIVISALEKDIDKLQAYKQGIVGYLVKPLEKNIIIQAIQKALEYK